MKKLLLSAYALSWMLGVNAQTYFSENFDGGLGQFTSVDNDGDNYKWSTEDVSNYIDGTNGKVATSESWFWNGSNGVILTPDNLLTSSAIDLTGASGTIFLYWLVGSIASTDWQEYYDVIITTSNTVGDITTATPVFSEVLSGGGQMFARYVDVSSYAGQIIYLIFNHKKMMNIKTFLLTQK